jgi:hypothetical protein
MKWTSGVAVPAFRQKERSCGWPVDVLTHAAPPEFERSYQKAPANPISILLMPVAPLGA